jgi:uncharacterized repeat protein (TIGR01451 family)
MKGQTFRIITVVILLAFALSPIQAATADAPPPPTPELPLAPGGQGAKVEPLSKLDSELRDLAAQGGTEPVVVYIHAEEGADLSKVVEVVERRPLPFGGELVVAKVLPDKIGKMASHPGVQAAEAFHAIEAPIPLTPKEDQQRPTREQIKELREKAKAYKEHPETAPARELPGGLTPAAPSSLTSPSGTSDWHGVDLIGAQDAWAKGYTGEGVNIAIIDSGVDFGHPDLEGKQAVYESGPYEGWPIALDPRSMRQYYYNGYTSWDNYNDWWDYTWYAGVYDVIHCTSGIEASFEFNAITYTIDASITALSQSGEIRWGVHPDEQFADFVYNWVPFILLDTTTAGVYDTVIADMNFDYWFDGYDDVADKADPVLSQDLGSYIYTDTLVMTGTQYVPDSWFWGGGPPTWYGWEVVTETTTLPAGSWIWAENHWTSPGATDGADGIAEVSGGMVYYIADGVHPVPGMDYLYPGWGPAGMPPVPFNGQLVAFMIGSYWAGGGEHGTLCASAAAAGGQSKGYFSPDGEWVQYETEDWTNFPFGDGSGDPGTIMDWLKGSTDGTVQGPAPGAKIIALGDNYAVVNDMQGMYDSYTFLAYGVDGEPNSGDEFVDIVSMSYGDGSVHNDGWDWESRLLSYYNQNFLSNTTLFASSGNGGHGFGTVNTPQGNTAVSVGGSTQYGASTVFGSALELGQLNDGDVTPFSGRGPDAMGRPDPDVTATGAWGAGDVPLNLAPAIGAFWSWYVQDGNQAWYEWGGTSRSSPEAAGVGALVYQAYKDANGVFPDFETARQILMSGADDLKHDVLMQGAGRVNADRATDVAGDLGGVYVSPSLLAAGEYQGSQYESFANVLYPGDNWSQTFTVHNTGTSPASVDVDDEVLTQIDVLTYTQVVKPYTGDEDGTSDAYYYYANYFVGANPLATTHGDDLVVPVPAEADLMQVELLVPFEIFDFAYQDPDPGSVSYAMSQRWSLTVYDWTDRNGDGILWDDKDADGIVNPSASTDIVDVSYTGSTDKTEINRYGYGYNYGNHNEVTVRLDEARKADDKIVIGIVHRNKNDTRPGWGAAEYDANPLLVKVTFYQKSDWSLVSESSTSLNVPAGGSATFDANFAIPANQPPGLYEGAITVDDGTHLSIIPVTVNVAVPSDELLFTLGGTLKAGTPYDNGRMVGGWTWYSVLEEGDWRFYYYDAAASFEQQYLYVDNTWGDLCGNMPTFNETLVWGPNPGDQFSLAEPEKYGPYGMQYAGGTWDANGPQTGWYDPRMGDWWWSADGPQPESRAWASLWDGLNQVQFRNILLSGKRQCGEGFEATAGVFGVDAPASGIVVNTNTETGSFTIDAVSPVDGLIAYPYGFGQAQWFRNQDVPQGKHDEEWPADLLDGWVYEFDAVNLSSIGIDTQGPGSSDIDLYLMYDANGDGFFNVFDNRERLDNSYNSGSYEDIWYNGDFSSGYNVQDGRYAVIMYGYSVVPGDQFNLKLTLYGGEGLSIEGSRASNNYVLETIPGEPTELTVNYTVPGPGIWSGMLWFAMPWDEEPQNWYQGPVIEVPVFINKEGAIVGLDKQVSEEEVHFGSVLTYTIDFWNEGAETVGIEVTDMLPAGLALDELSLQSTLQGTDYWDEYCCELGYDEWMRTIWYECGLGGAYPQDTITFQARVVAQQGTIFLNKADLKWYAGEPLPGVPYSYLYATAYSYVPWGLYLPLVFK